MIYTKEISIETSSDTDIVDITDYVRAAVRESGIRNGSVLVFVPGSTASVSTIEYEPNLIKDVKRVLEKIAPRDAHYEHHKTWGDDNGSAHVRATLMGPSTTIPFKDSELILGTWQQIVLLDFDTRVRARRIVIQVSGE